MSRFAGCSMRRPKVCSRAFALAPPLFTLALLFSLALPLQAPRNLVDPTFDGRARVSCQSADIAATLSLGFWLNISFCKDVIMREIASRGREIKKTASTI